MHCWLGEGRRTNERPKPPVCLPLRLSIRTQPPYILEPERLSSQRRNRPVRREKPAASTRTQPTAFPFAFRSFEHSRAAAFLYHCYACLRCGNLRATCPKPVDQEPNASSTGSLQPLAISAFAFSALPPGGLGPARVCRSISIHSLLFLFQPSIVHNYSNECPKSGPNPSTSNGGMRRRVFGNSPLSCSPSPFALLGLFPNRRAFSVSFTGCPTMYTLWVLISWTRTSPFAPSKKPLQRAHRRPSSFRPSLSPPIGRSVGRAAAEKMGEFGGIYFFHFILLFVSSVFRPCPCSHPSLLECGLFSEPNFILFGPI